MTQDGATHSDDAAAVTMPRTIRPVAMVTGASAGIGAAFAEALAARGYDLVLTARREERLAALAARLAADHDAACLVLPADLADPQAPQALMRAVAEAGWRVDMLVNNAGYAVPGDYADSLWLAQRDFMTVMVTAVAELSHLCLPGMIARGRGQILNIASLAAFLPGAPGSTQYGAAKAWMLRFSEALSQELRGSGVTVSAICPGFTYSEFHDITGSRETVARLPRWLWMDAQAVARQGIDAALAGRPVVVTGRVNRIIALAFRLMPAALATALVARASGRFRRRQSGSGPPPSA
ncbi:SDR family NAD(P)-dependent oxidoreductase [Marinibaculum pumilum]|uniref:SDR family NAD(P)-dependent oxidoreductase n=1 Tax=Marinibaculum pumilum TaxID=1766165 RepID=A0ABV7KX26_9PROT